jgi:bifunctional non-homologous end joining protein LigD
MGLTEYKKKRNFGATPEPAGKVKKAKGNSFVIQKHAATRLHYDFRLEMEGVLRSWAVPKGPSLDPGEKRLAVHVEDHPIDYGDFEGIIPKGQYGGGTVLLWDRGTWEPLGDLDAVAAYRKGHLKFRLDGEKLQGGWALVRMGGRNQEEGHENWLLIKEKDDEAVPGSADAVTEENPDSVASGRAMAEIAADPERVWQSNHSEKAGKAGKNASFKDKIAAKAAKTAAKTAKQAARTPAKKAVKPAAKKATAKPPVPKRTPRAVAASGVPGARKAALPAAAEVELATLVDAVPPGDGWIHEIKYDGYRALCEINDGEARLITRGGKDWTDRFAAIARAAATLPAERALLDGEVVVLEPDGRSSFQALQNALSEERQEDLVYFAFDLLYLDGYDLRPAALLDRKGALAELLANRDGQENGAIHLSGQVEGEGEAFFRQACQYGLEGIVCKRAAAPYRGGRGKDWLKVKCLNRQELAIVGFTDPERSRVGFGALLLAVNDDAGKLVYAGKVGTGFDDETLTTLRARMDKLEIQKPAFLNPPRGAEARRSHWLKPKLVGEVAFTEWTRDGILRHPTFQGLREDKRPEEIVRETPQDPPKTAKSTAPPKVAKKTAKTSAKKGDKPALRPEVEAVAVTADGRSKKKEVEIAGVRFSNPDKVLYPEQGVTKGELGLYYARIADWILPHLADRPLTLVRCPEGRAKQCFYQKHATEHFPPTVHRVDVGESEPYAAIDSLEGLLGLAQMGVLELHIWGSHNDRIEQPDYVVFDFDPDEGLGWERVVEGATAMRAFLENLGLQTFLKSTGGKGLHVCLPLTRKDDWDEVKAFTKAVAEKMVAAEPAKYTSKLPKASRKGKIFIDYLRNGRGATSICAYSTRARADAPVSVPLFWEELETGVRGNTYTLRTVPERLEALPSDPWADFFKIRQSITAAMKKAVGMK